MTKAKESTKQTDGSGTAEPWKHPGQAAQDPKNHPPPPPERKEREDRHNETS